MARDAPEQAAAVEAATDCRRRERPVAGRRGLGVRQLERAEKGQRVERMSEVPARPVGGGVGAEQLAEPLAEARAGLGQ